MRRPSFKIVIRQLIRVRTLNRLLRGILKPFSSFLPDSVTERIPVVGIVALNLLPAKSLYFEANGNDVAATRLYWKSVEGYESETLRLFIKLLGHSRTILDVGANTGIFALLAAAENPGRQVYAFEPVARVHERLERNVRLNKLSNLQTFQTALTNYDGEVMLYVPSWDLPTEASTAPGYRETSEAVPVPALKVDSFVANYGIPKVDLMKVDTETTEPLVLEGAREVLHRDEPFIICEVLKGRTERALQELLDPLGYEYFLITDNGLVRKDKIEGDETYRFFNYLFVNKNRVQEIAREICLN